MNAGGWSKLATVRRRNRWYRRLFVGVRLLVLVSGRLAPKKVGGKLYGYTNTARAKISELVIRNRRIGPTETHSPVFVGGDA
eukprot:scaffold70286_cov57-Attheya_sp.AAC.1